MMKSRFRMAALLLSLMLVLSSCAIAEQKQSASTPTPEASAENVSASTPAPENEEGMPYLLNDLEGSPLVFSELKGKLVLLNFFTTWCTYCKEEMPDLLKLQQKYGEDLTVILIHVPDGETEEDAKAFVKENGLDSLRMVEDADQFLASYYQLEGYPLSVIIDKEGYLMYYQPGMLTYEQMEQIAQEGGLTAPETVTQ